MKTVLLVVDMQNDFCLPSGSLYVPGAEKDVERLSRLIKEKMTVIDKIILTADEHHVMDIAHPSYWKRASGSFYNYFMVGGIVGRVDPFRG